jgi:hypothetical protein
VGSFDTLPRHSPTAAGVHGAFCFVEGELPLIGTPEIRGFPLLHRKLLARRLDAKGPLTPQAVAATADALAARLKPA